MERVHVNVTIRTSFRHYKALIARHQYANIPEDEDEDHCQNCDSLNQIQKEMLDLHLALLNYALTRGYSYHR